MFFKNDDDMLDMIDKMKDSKNKERLKAIQKSQMTEKSFIPKPKQQIKPKFEETLENKNKLSDEELLKKIQERKIKNIKQNSPINKTFYKNKDLEYATFLDRFLATIMDIIFVLIPLAFWQYITEEIISDGHIIKFLFEWLIPFVITMIFWIKLGATPGKLIMKMYIVDQYTGEKMDILKSFIRYVGYIPSLLIFCIGFIWIIFDDRKQSWHDKIAGTVVIEERRREERRREEMREKKRKR